MRVDTKCGCHLKPETLEIEYCPLHGAAEEMLDTLVAMMDDHWTECTKSLAERAESIIAKAKGEV